MTNKGIRLHTTKGVNPRLTVCAWCGKDVGVVLLGANDRKYKCNTCGVNVVGSTLPPRRCPTENCTGTLSLHGHIGDYEKIPAGLCTECGEKDRAAKDAVVHGGVMWRCKDCGSQGAIKNSPFAQYVRKSHGQRYTEHDADGKYPICGVELNKEQGCPVCTAGDGGTE